MYLGVLDFSSALSMSTGRSTKNSDSKIRSKSDTLCDKMICKANNDQHVSFFNALSVSLAFQNPWLLVVYSSVMNTVGKL